MRILSFIVAAIVICMCNACYPQSSDMIVTVLKKDQPNKTFLFDSTSKKDGSNKFYVTYMGTISTNNRMLKIVTWKKIWGPNQHTIGIVYVYGSKNEYIGKYPLGSGFDLPKKIENNQLVFTNEDKNDCDSKLNTTVDFSKEIPQKIFLRCKGEYGDIYPFVTEK